MNRRGEKPLSLTDNDTERQTDHPIDLLAGESITRFDKSKNKKKKKKGNKPQNRGLPFRS